MTKRSVFFLSDHTGITVEAMGRSLLSQFPALEYDTVHWPFIDTIEKAKRAAGRINQETMRSGARPLVFSTLVDPTLRACFRDSAGLIFDFFEHFTQPIEEELQIPSAPALGRLHSIGKQNAYNERIHAVNYALTNDDGAVTRNYDSADLILIGVSRSGKTPTCLFMGLQHGILAANYPLTDDDLDDQNLPRVLQPYVEKLYGLTIDPRQLQRIRKERRANGRYSSFEQCLSEVQRAERLFKRHNIRFLDTTAMSIEEIAARLLQEAGQESRLD
ncbi:MULTISPECIES: posphoenolpyruvate synthetase regulatory kinase/phosphorylase PpsR [sulfur-oxidizing symbionts]|jgi:regulator of PEP synthase PpsR (kinase-PPPase family)|uniref:Putative phosphoenolpyruvate synthase regulatory protein n=2 Tax=sulfur-oxidizing symbionts TaxID=32036 RepID=G2DAN8_9GAMM|nr:MULTISPECIES: pyruvate, water dikinase regulatory protein [sulfur-oxidizing symbionts]EGV52285.1 putative phosphotransferase [endosymbiont of Riftia pachyptila (vent Ph05)]KRT55896.1 hypothetical protein Ga0074115_1275 [endosymbiont of Ridgeia piscesae]KRT57185.1 hypothetical protein Ga0076813_11172 [endosymbiont of Ridgeia piscesae]